MRRITHVVSACRVQASAIAMFGVLVLTALPVRASDSLNYTKNYFVTGDAVTAGVGLRGKGAGHNGVATGTINISGIPCTGGSPAVIVPCTQTGAVPADIVAAYLYWETEESAAKPAAGKGFFDTHQIVGFVRGNSKNPGCSSGTSGRVYRADVLPFLASDLTKSFRLANGAHTVSLPDTDVNGTLANGASLVIVYRVAAAGSPGIVPLRSVVIYDGAFTLNKTSSLMSQTVRGFYQPTNSAAARMTQIVGGGQAGFTESLKVDGTNFSNPFTGKAGGSWDNSTININLDDDDYSFQTQVTSSAQNVCLTWSAIIASTNVLDSDGDGLLDIWETKGLHFNPGDSTHSATFGGCSDYPAEPCVNLPAMGANPNRKDIFVEIDWMHGASWSSGGSNGGDHTHIPKLSALNGIGFIFALHGILVHFDVGNNYQTPQCR